MEIRLSYFDGCPGWETARDRIRTVLEELAIDDARFTLDRVDSPEGAERRRFVGSPTILIDGRDLFPAPEGGFGLACRVYETAEGLAGSPSLDQIRRALSART